MFDGAQVNGGSSFVFRGLTLLLLLREPTQIAKCLMAQKTHASRVEAGFAIWVTFLLMLETTQFTRCLMAQKTRVCARVGNVFIDVYKMQTSVFFE